MKKAILALFFIIIGNNAFAQSKVFFDNISVGDNLEKCIAKGLVESTGGPNAGTPFEWELTDSNIKIHFQRTGVVFDNNNIVKEIELLASDYTNKNNRKSVDVKKSFNYMLQYFSQRYTGMKQRDFKTEGISSCLYDVGKEYYWETSNLLIKVQLYNNIHNEEAHDKQNRALGDFCMDEWMRSGKFAKVKIIRK